MHHSILKKIARIRIQKKFSQSYMASQLNISQSYYNKIESGKNELNIQRMVKIAKILNVRLSELIDTDESISV